MVGLYPVSCTAVCSSVKSWDGPSKFWGSGPPNPPVVAPLHPGRVTRISDVDLTVVTDFQPLSTGARLRLANPGCVWPSCIIIIHATRLTYRPQPESGCGHRTGPNTRRTRRLHRVILLSEWRQCWRQTLVILTSQLVVSTPCHTLTSTPISTRLTFTPRLIAALQRRQWDTLVVRLWPLVRPQVGLKSVASTWVEIVIIIIIIHIINNNNITCIYRVRVWHKFFIPYRIYASCFSPMACGKLWEVFIIMKSLP